MEAAEAGLRRHCREQLSAFKVPVKFLFRPAAAFPRTATGKVDRRRLCEEVARAVAGGAPEILPPHEGGERDR